jgi:hypothetical protein
LIAEDCAIAWSSNVEIPAMPFVLGGLYLIFRANKNRQRAPTDSNRFRRADHGAAARRDGGRPRHVR